MKAEMKEKTMRAFLISQKHIVYTEPLEVRAGTTVDVFYNPSNSVLNGKPEVWFRGSFNRWTHPSGPLPPQKMVKAENGSHLRATGARAYNVSQCFFFSWSYLCTSITIKYYQNGLLKYLYPILLVESILYGELVDIFSIGYVAIVQSLS